MNQKTTSLFLCYEALYEHVCVCVCVYIYIFPSIWTSLEWAISLTLYAFSGFTMWYILYMIHSPEKLSLTATGTHGKILPLMQHREEQSPEKNRHLHDRHVLSHCGIMQFSMLWRPQMVVVLTYLSVDTDPYHRAITNYAAELKGGEGTRSTNLKKDWCEHWISLGFEWLDSFFRSDFKGHIKLNIRPGLLN